MTWDEIARLSQGAVPEVARGYGFQPRAYFSPVGLVRPPELLIYSEREGVWMLLELPGLDTLEVLRTSPRELAAGLVEFVGRSVADFALSYAAWRRSDLWC
jgi:hypothetical protein